MNESTTSTIRAQQIATIHRGKKDLQAGRTVSNAKVQRCLRTWGSKREKPAPSCR